MVNYYNMLITFLMILCFVLLFQYFFVYKKYNKDLLNPLFYFGYEYAVKVILGFIFLYSSQNIDQGVLEVTTVLAIMYPIFINIGFLLPVKLFFLKSFIKSFVSYKSSNELVSKNYKFIILALIFLFLVKKLTINRPK